MGRTNIVFEHRKHRHDHRHFLRRAGHAFILVGSVVLIGTLGMHYLENYSYINAFYFVAMLATGEGPTTTPVTTAGKLFASLIAFVSVGTVLFSLAYLFGPFLTTVFKKEAEMFVKDEEAIRKDL